MNRSVKMVMFKITLNGPNALTLRNARMHIYHLCSNNAQHQVRDEKGQKG